VRARPQKNINWSMKAITDSPVCAAISRKTFPQVDLDIWICECNEARPHQGRWCFGKTPMQTFLDAMPMTKEKMIAA
jgi:hypothetical protein